MVTPNEIADALENINPGDIDEYEAIQAAIAHLRAQGAWRICRHCGWDCRPNGVQEAEPDSAAAAGAIPAWPEGLIDRVRQAADRMANNYAPRRIPAEPSDVDLVLGEVLHLLEGREPPFWVEKMPRKPLFAAAPSQPAEPVKCAHCGRSPGDKEHCDWIECAALSPAEPVAQAEQEPRLTDEQIMAIAQDYSDFSFQHETLEFARAIERAVRGEK